MIICIIFAHMNKLILRITLAASVIFSCLHLTSCNDNLPAPDEKLPGNTVIVYMGAENSLASYSQRDLDEMKSALGDIPEDCQVVVYRDAELKPAIFHLTSKKFTTWYEYKEDHNSADMTTMQSVLEKIVKGFPSATYSLVLWSHGTGWTDRKNAPQKSIIVDNGQNTQSNRGQWLHVGQLANILKSMPHMEFIFFDACYMQSVEVASHLYPFTDYIIGSPTEIPALGAPYNLIMKALCRADIPGIINGYASGYSGTQGVLLSAVHSDDFMDFCAATAKFIPRAFPSTGMPSVDGIQIYAPEYGLDDFSRQSDMPVPYDMRSAMYHVLDAADYGTWEEHWKKTILYPAKAGNWASVYSNLRYGNAHQSLTDPEHYGGISMNIPRKEYQGPNWDAQFKLSPWYAFTLWEEAGW